MRISALLYSRTGAGARARHKAAEKGTAGPRSRPMRIARHYGGRAAKKGQREEEGTAGKTGNTYRKEKGILWHEISPY